MPDETLRAPASRSVTLSTSYLGSGNRYIVSGHGVEVASDDASIGLVVQLWPVGQTHAVLDSNEYEEIVPAGVPFVGGLAQGQTWYLDVKSASGTPAAKIRVY